MEFFNFSVSFNFSSFPESYYIKFRNYISKYDNVRILVFSRTFNKLNARLKFIELDIFQTKIYRYMLVTTLNALLFLRIISPQRISYYEFYTPSFSCCLIVEFRPADLIHHCDIFLDLTSPNDLSAI